MITTSSFSALPVIPWSTAVQTQSCTSGKDSAASSTSVVEVVRTDDARLRRGIGVVEARVGQHALYDCK